MTLALLVLVTLMRSTSAFHHAAAPSEITRSRYGMMTISSSFSRSTLFAHQPKRDNSSSRHEHLLHFGRRQAILTGIAKTTGLVVLPIDHAVAAPPLSAGEADNVGARLSRALRPKPPKILRPKLDLDFAVLLMRSSYNVLDELDVVAMDQFQRDFFLIRQAEYQPYINLLGAGFVKQGDLTDPYYFDFICFAQYKAINREITMDPAFVFEEKQPVQVPEGEPQEFVSKVIRRDPSLTNDMLPTEHSNRVGKRILERFDTLFGGTKSGLPASTNGRASTIELQAALEQLVKLFLLNGFAWDGNSSLVSQDSNGKLQFCLSVTSPATIWGGQSLQGERCPLQNDYLYVCLGMSHWCPLSN